LPGGFSLPHAPQRNGSGWPQSPQNRLPSGLASPHRGQFIRSPVEPDLFFSVKPNQSADERHLLDFRANGNREAGDDAVDIGRLLRREFTTAPKAPPDRPNVSPTSNGGFGKPGNEIAFQRNDCFRRNRFRRNLAARTRPGEGPGSTR
jgi:hypothetical protein